MTDPLRSEIVTPTHVHSRRIALLGLGCGAIGAAVAFAATRSAALFTFEAPAPTVVTEQVVVPVAMPTFVMLEAPAPDPLPTSELSFVFRAGGVMYMKLASLVDADAETSDAHAEAKPRHAAPKLVTDNYVDAAVATVQPHDVPLAHRAWQGRTVKVDGTCEAKVTGFAVVSRLTGDPAYAGIDQERWTAATVMSRGAAVLAARIEGCAEGTFARDAKRTDVIVPEELADARLAAAARKALIDSPPSRDVQREWTEMQSTGTWHAETAITTRVLRHPVTGVTWVYAHGEGELGCGAPNVNVFGLFRVDANGALVATQLRRLGELSTIDRLVDVDRDGEFEIIGKPWVPSDTILTRASGEELTRLALPFYGCPC